MEQSVLNTEFQLKTYEATNWQFISVSVKTGDITKLLILNCHRGRTTVTFRDCHLLKKSVLCMVFGIVSAVEAVSLLPESY